MSFMCSAGSATATVKSNTTAAQDTAAGGTNTAAQTVDASKQPLMPDAPDLTSDLVEQARKRMGMNLLAGSDRNKAFANAPSSGATATYSLLK